MADASRDRSPAYPIIPLGTALERLAQFDAHFKRSAARPETIGGAWGIKAQAHADRTAAALRYFGLLEYMKADNGSRAITTSELGRNYLRAQQESVKQSIAAAAALKPKQIAIFWNRWGTDRPADPACLDELVLQNGFSENGARDFLRVYDATIAFAKPNPDDKVLQSETIDGDGNGNGGEEPPRDEIPPPPPPPQRRVNLMEGERELTTGMLAKDATFRLIVSGKVGVKEIDRLIKKLELDKEILGEQDEDWTAIGSEPEANQN